MKHLKNKSGFTLLEIIIVVIIIGVLASLALPRFFKTVEFTRSAEALNSLSSIRQSLERCYLRTSNYGQCTFTNSAADNLDIDNPSTAVGTHFTYSMLSANPTPGIAAYGIQAYRLSTIDGGDVNSWIKLELAAGGITRSGSGFFSGIK